MNEKASPPRIEAPDGKDQDLQTGAPRPLDPVAVVRPVVGHGSIPQADPGGELTYYQFLDGSGQLLAELLATNPGTVAEGGFQEGTEYWKIQGDRFQSVHCAKIIKVAKRWCERLPFTVKETSFYCMVRVSWQSPRSMPPGPYAMVSDGGFQTDLRLDSQTWKGCIHWVNLESEGDYVFKHVPAGGELFQHEAAPEGSRIACVDVQSLFLPL